jgi:coenzyme PQQ precursor peptide PqqA
LSFCTAQQTTRNFPGLPLQYNGRTAPAPVRFPIGPARQTGSNRTRRKQTMKTWRKPKIREIAVGNEINAYACADL